MNGVQCLNSVNFSSKSIQLKNTATLNDVQCLNSVKFSSTLIQLENTAPNHCRSILNVVQCLNSINFTSTSIQLENTAPNDVQPKFNQLLFNIFLLSNLELHHFTMFLHKKNYILNPDHQLEGSVGKAVRGRYGDHITSRHPTKYIGRLNYYWLFYLLFFMNVSSTIDA